MAIKTVRNKGKDRGLPPMEKHLTMLKCPTCGAEVCTSQFAVQMHVRMKHRDLPTDKRHALERQLYPAMADQLKMNLLKDALARRVPGAGRSRQSTAASKAAPTDRRENLHAFKGPDGKWRSK
jgi:hypothetical protein